MSNLCQITCNCNYFIIKLIYKIRECDIVIYPSIDKLLKIVDSKYTLAYIASERSKQMIKTGYYQKPIKDYKSKKEIGRALEEIYDKPTPNRIGTNILIPKGVVILLSKK